MENSATAPEDGSNSPNIKNSDGTQKNKIISWLKRNLTRNGGEESNLHSDLQEVMQEHVEGGNIITEENEILRNALKFNEIRVTNVMTPRLDIGAVPANISLDELKKYIDEHEHTRIPIFDKNLDDVVGFIHIKDLIAYWITPREFKIHEILREVLFVPPSMKIYNLLVKMRAERTHMAIVVDEYGGTAGLVTIEDLVEELVGEIDDEHDEENQEEFVQTSDDTYEVLGRVEIKKLEEGLGIKLSDDDAENSFGTVGGLIFANLGRIPRIGETVRHDKGLIFKVIDADKRRIKRIKITKTGLPGAEMSESISASSE